MIISNKMSQKRHSLICGFKIMLSAMYHFPGSGTLYTARKNLIRKMIDKAIHK